MPKRAVRMRRPSLPAEASWDEMSFTDLVNEHYLPT